MVGLLSGSPGNALKANVLKSEDSTNDKETGISCPVKVPPATASAAPMDAAAGGEDIQ